MISGFKPEVSVCKRRNNVKKGLQSQQLSWKIVMKIIELSSNYTYLTVTWWGVKLLPLTMCANNLRNNLEHSFV